MSEDKMTERDEILEELGHLLRYHSQAIHDFFDDLNRELAERTNLLALCLKGKTGTREEMRALVSMLVATQDALRKRLEDLDFLTSKMLKLL